MARDSSFDGLGALAHQRLHRVERLAQGAGLVDLREDRLSGPPGFQGLVQQFLNFLAFKLQMPGGLVNADLEKLLHLFIGQIGGLDKKVGQRRVPGGDGGSCCEAAERGQGAGKLRWRQRLAADECDGCGLGAFAQDINQPVKQVAAHRNQFGIGVVELGIALEREDKLLLVGKDALGVGGKRRLVNLAADFFRHRANCAQPIQNEAAEL